MALLLESGPIAVMVTEMRELACAIDESAHPQQSLARKLGQHFQPE